MLQLISYPLNLASFVLGIIVLVKLFQQKGALHGILGILSCFLYPFIWGWLNVTRLNIKNIMLAWTVCWVIGLVLGGMNAVAVINAASSQPTIP